MKSLKIVYKIYTEMDANSQTNMQQTYENAYLFPTSESDGSTAQSASVATWSNNWSCPWSDESCGGTSDTTFRNFNYGLRKRSPGSTHQTFSGLCPSSGFRMEHHGTFRINQSTIMYTPTNYGGVEDRGCAHVSSFGQLLQYQRLPL